MPRLPHEIRMHARHMGFTRGASVQPDDIGLPVVLDGYGPDGLPLDIGEVLVVNRSATQRPTFGDTRVNAVTALALGGTAGVLAVASSAKLNIGILGSLWVKCLAAGTSVPVYVFFR